MLHCNSSHSIVTRGSRVSRALPHHILPAFLNLNGSLSTSQQNLIAVSTNLSPFLQLYENLNRKRSYHFYFTAAPDSNARVNWSRYRRNQLIWRWKFQYWNNYQFRHQWYVKYFQNSFYYVEQRCKKGGPYATKIFSKPIGTTDVKFVIAFILCFDRHLWFGLDLKARTFQIIKTSDVVVFTHSQCFTNFMAVH